MHYHRSFLLLVSLVLLLFAVPVASFLSADMAIFGQHLIAAVFALMLVATAAAVSRGWKAVVAALVLAAPAAVLQLIEPQLPYESGLVAEYILSLAYFGFAIWVLLRLVLTSAHVTVDTLCTALSVYLLLGVFWAIAYSLLDIAEPGASFFHSLDAVGTEEPMRFGAERSVYPLYFSFVTMTTLGYGDIVPNSPSARMLAAAQAVVGQFYVAVLLARLVALHVTDARRDTTDVRRN
jgi:voltage-gated potassium channel